MSDRELSDAIADISAGHTDARTLARLGRVLSISARRAGAGAVASGRWLSEMVIDVAPRIPVRDKETLVAHHGGKTGDALAEELIRNATRVSAAIGAAAGALAGAQEMAPPAWLVLPLELVVETLAVAAVEMKLVAELHEALDRPISGAAGEKATAVVKAWAERRGVSPATLARRGGLTDVLGRRARNQLVKTVRRRIVGRLGRNLSSFIPLFVGAVAGAAVNRSATRAVGEAIAGDLRSGR